MPKKLTAAQAKVLRLAADGLVVVQFSASTAPQVEPTRKDWDVDYALTAGVQGPTLRALAAAGLVASHPSRWAPTMSEDWARGRDTWAYDRLRVSAKGRRLLNEHNAPEAPHGR